jgi:D-beta-D-heptose 7-phosphate kinase/D-beta-D-heptose 1-phosphate adenosyltransferase
MTAIELPKAAPENKILLIGDLLIDETIWVNTTKISPEAPVPVAEILPGDIHKESPGGAGFAAAFAAKEGISVQFLTACPPHRVHWLNNLGIQVHYYDIEDNVKKTRYIDKPTGYHLIRVDTDKVVMSLSPQSTNDIASLTDIFYNVIKQEKIGIIALLDYRKGLLSNRDFTQQVIKTGKKANIPVYTDSRSSDLTKFKGTTVLKLNSLEFTAACKLFNIGSPEELMSELETDNLLVTKGDDGASAFFMPETDITRVPISKLKEVSHRLSSKDIGGRADVTGCGDVFDIAFCWSWGIKQMSIEDALVYSVERASHFAHEDIGERIAC